MCERESERERGGCVRGAYDAVAVRNPAGRYLGWPTSSILVGRILPFLAGMDRRIGHLQWTSCIKHVVAGRSFTLKQHNSS